MGFDFLVPIFAILVVLVPVTGVTAILTLRLGGKPFVEMLARELGAGRGADTVELAMRVADLTEQVESLTSEVHELRAGQSFDHQLLESRGSD